MSGLYEDSSHAGVRSNDVTSEAGSSRTLILMVAIWSRHFPVLSFKQHKPQPVFILHSVMCTVYLHTQYSNSNWGGGGVGGLASAIVRGRVQEGYMPPPVLCAEAKAG